MTRRRAVPIKKDPVTWILVADGTRAQMYVRATREKKVPTGGGATHRHYDESLVPDMTPVPGTEWRAESPSIYETGPDRLGRVQESASSAHHMAEPHINIHDEIKLHFAKAIADRLNEAKAKKSFDRLVLVAPARMLEELRRHLDKKVLRAITAELPKDLTHCDNGELVQHLQDAGPKTA